ncbi:MAG: methyltransferase domain-containing protein [Deltaproteobacteria bacterium]|nr:methyltransferase domain-containing protein [Deltaproteobacteria bacterium]TLN01651.1 MAG: methyltransferase domain-containing protein [bacterium]
MRTEGLGGAVGFSHFFLRRVIRPGDRVIDATCGRGQDTLFLAGLVGSCGEVWAFDVQEEALAETAERLRSAGCSPWVNLVHAGHESLASYVREPVRAVVFNLGYLPGDRAGLVTRPDTTLLALDQSVRLLLPGGMVVLAIYTGHQGGDEEAACVEAWASGLSSREFNVWKSRQLNRSDSAPYVVIVGKVPPGK